MNLRMFNQLMAEAVVDGSQTAGQPSGTLLGGSGGAGANAGAANSGVGNSGSGTPGTNQAANTGAQGYAAGDWRLGLPDELRAEAAFKSINDLPTLAKSYLHAQKLVGADKIPVPSKHATKEDWKTVYQKLGLPIDVKDYTVKEPEAIKGEFVDQFKVAAHQAGILPQQAQEVLDWFAQANAAAMQKNEEAGQQTIAQQIEGLKQEWGLAFNDKVAQARHVIQKFGDPDLIKHMDESGLGNDVKLIKFMSKVGEQLKESGIVGGDGTLSGAKAPKEAMKEIRTIQGNKDHPYHNKTHPNHNAAVQEMQELFKQAYPSA